MTRALTHLFVRLNYGKFVPSNRQKRRLFTIGLKIFKMRAKAGKLR
ncbi:MAG: hypothetical protein KME29_13425 [Calothrix sp. FI2-JRJ7]|nr:hypothetical protein [Calothrix sp. FI2-JRJ7]